MKKIEIGNGQPPFRMYENTLMLSSDNTEKKEQDFILIGDEKTIIAHLCILMNRHEIFKNIIQQAAMLHHYSQTHNPDGSLKKGK